MKIFAKFDENGIMVEVHTADGMPYDERQLIDNGFTEITEQQRDLLCGHYKYVDGEVIEVNKSLDELKTAKLAEVNAWTAAKITGGFLSSCSGEPVTYDSDKETQLTVSGDMATINLASNEFAEHYPAGYPMRGYPAGTDTSDSSNKVIYYLTFEQLIQWNVDLGLHRGSCKQDGWLKQAEIEKAVTKEDLDAIILD